MTGLPRHKANLRSRN